MRANANSFRLWVSGYVTDQLDSTKFLKIVCDPLIIAISTALGFGAGVIVYILLDAIGMGQNLWAMAIFLTLQPVVINFAGWGIVHLPRMGTTSPSMLIPTSVLFLIPSTAVFIAFDGFLLHVCNLNIAIETLFLIIVFRVPVYEVVIYIIFKHIVPDIFFTAPGHSGAAAAPASILDSLRDQDQQSARHMEIGNISIQQNRIVMIEAQGNYVSIVTPERNYLERFRISDAVESIEENCGFSPHRSYWVAYEFIDGYMTGNGALRIRMRDGSLAKVSSKRKSAVRALLKERSFRRIVDGETRTALPKTLMSSFSPAAEAKNPQVRLVDQGNVTPAENGSPR